MDTKFLDGSYKLNDLIEAGKGIINKHTFEVVPNSKKSKYGTGKKTVISIHIDSILYENVAIDVIKKKCETAVNDKPHSNGRKTKKGMYTKDNILRVLRFCVKNPQKAANIVTSLDNKIAEKEKAIFERDSKIADLYKQIELLKKSIK